MHERIVPAMYIKIYLFPRFYAAEKSTKQHEDPQSRKYIPPAWPYSARANSKSKIQRHHEHWEHGEEIIIVHIQGLEEQYNKSKEQCKSTQQHHYFRSELAEKEHWSDQYKNKEEH